MYVLLIIYMGTAGADWQTIKYREAFPSLKECEARHASWKAALKTQYTSGACYYTGRESWLHAQ